MTRLGKVGRALAAGLAVALLASGCSTRAPSDFIVLYYTSGDGENHHWQECIEPGQSGSYPVDDETFALPISLRTWNIAVNGGDTDVPITSGSLPAPVLDAAGQPIAGQSRQGPEVNVWATTDFYLNTDCTGGEKSPVVQFWDKTGRRSWKDGHGIAVDGDDKDSFKEDAWRVMLQNTLVPAMQKAIREQTRRYSADDLDANTNGVWTLVERQLGPAFNAALRDKVGGDYFCGPQYQRGQEVEWDEFVETGVDERGLTKFATEKRRGKCPPVRISITDAGFANPDIARARADVYAAEQRAKAALIDAQSKADVAARLEQVSSSPGYLELQRIQAQLEATKAQLAAAEACRANPNCTVIVDGTGAAGLSVGRR